jgi:hypothetical protein
VIATWIRNASRSRLSERTPVPQAVRWTLSGAYFRSIRYRSPGVPSLRSYCASTSPSSGERSSSDALGCET